MSSSLFSPSWYRVAALRPEINGHAVFHRHNYRGQTWHVIEDRAAERFHRFAPATYFVVGLMNGDRTLDDIWRAAIDKLGDNAPSQDEVIRLLAQLHAADLIKTSMTAEADELIRRYRAIDRQTWMKRFGAPFALKIPLFDPDRYLTVLVPPLRAVFTVWGFLVWAAVVTTGAILVALHWGELTQDIGSRILAPWNLAALLLAYPVLKLLHELGHAMAVKVWGGRVQDIGVMFILLVPIPYVDASASSSFPSKWRRVVVDAAGIMVELMLASLALMLWLDADPGLWRSFLFNVITIGTISTLLFNGNPLLKFDGYFILGDLIEIPNLAQRAQAYLGYLFDRYLLGARNKASPVSAPGERFWFLLYAPLAGIYRVFLTFSIALFLASQYMLVGLLLAAWAMVLMVIVPVSRFLKRLFTSGDMQRRRARAALVIGSIAASVFVIAFVIPAPRSTVAQGVAMVSDKGSVRANAEGFITEIVARPDALVRAGQPLIRISDPTVDAEVRVDQAQLAALQAQLNALDFTNEVDAAVVRQQIKAVEADLQNQNARQADQTIVSPTDGIFRQLNSDDDEGRFVRRGETIAYIEVPDRLNVTVIIDQSAYGDVQQGVEQIDIWPAGRGTHPVPARIALLHPGGLTKLPSPAFAADGGGDFPVDPRRPGEFRTLTNVFQIDLEPQSVAPTDRIMIGRHYLVRFEHAPQPIGLQLWGAARQLVLTRFGV